MKRLSLRFSIAFITFSIGIPVAAHWLLTRPLPVVDLPLYSPVCASELAAEIDLNDVRKTWRDELTTRFRETSLSESSANLEESYRLIWVPTFHDPTIIRLWRSGENYFIVTKRLRRKSNLTISSLQFERTTSLTPKEWHNFTDLIQQSCFWNAPSNIKEPIPDDGASWTFEGVNGGHYHFIDRIEPSSQMKEIFRSMFELTSEQMEYEEYL